MHQVTLKAYAKINLSLDTVGKRDDGYHLLEMIMQEVGLFDLVTVTKLDQENISVTTSVDFLPTSQDNIAYKACALMKAAFKLKGGYHIHIDKHIPIAAGLAGGSTDAAAVMKAMVELENLAVSHEDLMDLSLKIGSDIPFCLKGGTALVEGIGEKYTAVEAKSNYWVLLVKPNVSMSTAHVFKQHRWQDPMPRPNTPALIQALKANDLHAFSTYMANTLESVTAVECPQINQIKNQLIAYGALAAQMSGSGPTVFGLFKRDDQAKKALKNMKRFYQQAYLVRPIAGR